MKPTRISFPIMSFYLTIHDALIAALGDSSSEPMTLIELRRAAVATSRGARPEPSLSVAGNSREKLPFKNSDVHIPPPTSDRIRHIVDDGGDLLQRNKQLVSRTEAGKRWKVRRLAMPSPPPPVVECAADAVGVVLYPDIALLPGQVHERLQRRTAVHAFACARISPSLVGRWLASLEAACFLERANDGRVRLTASGRSEIKHAFAGLAQLTDALDLVGTRHSGPVRPLIGVLQQAELVVAADEAATREALHRLGIVGDWMQRAYDELCAREQPRPPRPCAAVQTDAGAGDDAFALEAPPPVKRARSSHKGGLPVHVKALYNQITAAQQARRGVCPARASVCTEDEDEET